MLILAGVSISILRGADGLFSQTENAKAKYNNGVEKENTDINTLMGVLDEYLSSTPIVPGEKKRDGSWNSDEGVNSPQLAAGMTAIYFDESGNSVELTESSLIEDWDKWYEYVEQTGPTAIAGSGTSKWANAQTEDGSYWVWIPRYAYKIKSNWGYYDVSSPQGEIDVVFIDTNNKNGDTTYSKTYPGVTNPGTATGSMNDFVVHPAFTWGTRELPGIWVAKFEASMSDAGGITRMPTSVETGDILTNATTRIAIKPGVSSWRWISNDKIFTNCKNMSNESNPYGFIATNTPHMMKNIEWGAVAYLSQSKYGRNRTEITINNSSSYITGRAGSEISAVLNVGTVTWISATGMLASTTGNIYGIYDMNGGILEYTAAYVDNTGRGINNIGDSTREPYNRSLLGASVEYKDVYSVGTSNNDTIDTNYTVSDPRLGTGKFGDAVYETSLNVSDATSWNIDSSLFPHTSSPVFIRGGHCNGASGAGIFYFSNYTGEANGGRGFRPVCFGGITL